MHHPLYSWQKNGSPKVNRRAVPILISYCYISWQCRGTFQRVQARSMIYHSSKQQIQWGLPASCSRPLERRIICSDNRLALFWSNQHLKNLLCSCEGPPEPLRKQKGKSRRKSSVSFRSWPILQCHWKELETTRGREAHHLASSSLLPAAAIRHPRPPLLEAAVGKYARLCHWPIGLPNGALGRCSKCFVLALCSSIDFWCVHEQICMKRKASASLV